MEKNTAAEKKPYEAPKLVVHGDVETITLGTDLGENLDATFSNSSNPRGTKEPKENAFS